jgi:hypothetical protein
VRAGDKGVGSGRRLFAWRETKALREGTHLSLGASQVVAQAVQCLVDSAICPFFFVPWTLFAGFAELLLSHFAQTVTHLTRSTDGERTAQVETFAG